VKLSIQSGCIIGVFILGMAFRADALHAEGAGGPKILIKAFQTEGNTAVSSRALEALFEREFGAWPIPDAGLEAGPEQVRKFLRGIAAFYHQRGAGGTFVYVANESLEQADPPTLKEGVLKVGVVEVRGNVIPTPFEAWQSAQGALTEAQEAARAAAEAKAEDARLQKGKAAAEIAAQKAQLVELEKARQAAKRVDAERSAQTRAERLRLIEEAQKEGERIQQERQKLLEEARAKRLAATEEEREETERLQTEREAQARAERLKFIEEARRQGERVRQEREKVLQEARAQGLAVLEKTRQELAQARQARIQLIEEARQEGERVRRERDAREKAETEAQRKVREEFERGIRAQAEAKSKKTLDAGGVLINVRSFATEGNALVSTLTLESLFARHVLDLEAPVVGAIKRFFPAEGMYIRPDELRGFLEEVLAYYAQLGHSGIYVYVPQETFASSPDPLRLKLQNDQLKVQVVEGRIQNITTNYAVQKRGWKKVFQRQKAADGEAAVQAGREPLSHKWRKRYIEKWAPIRPGDPIRKAELESYVDFLERRSGRSVAAVVQKAKEQDASTGVAGDVDVELRVRDYDPLTVYIESSNTGTVSTIELRYRVGLVHSDLTGRGDILSMDFSPGAQLEFLPDNYSAFASYEAPLWNPRWSGRLLTAWSEFKSVDLLGPNTSFIGKGTVLSGELKYKLWEGKSWFLDLYESLDYERSEVETPFGFTTILKLVDLGVGTRLGRGKDYKIPVSDDLSLAWKPSFDFKVVYNLTEMLDLSTATDFTEGRARTEPGYWYFRIRGGQSFTFDFAQLDEPSEAEKGDEEKKEEAEQPRGDSPVAERQRLRERLPPGKWLSINQQFGLHYSPMRLTPAKQFFVGGLNTVRGYLTSELGGDAGIFVSTDLRVDISRMLASRSKGETKGKWWKNFGLELVPFIIDFGMVRINEAAGNEEGSKWIAGTGAGGRFYYKDILSCRFNSGMALMDAGEDEDDTKSGDRQFHFDLALHF